MPNRSLRIVLLFLLVFSWPHLGLPQLNEKAESVVSGKGKPAYSDHQLNVRYVLSGLSETKDLALAPVKWQNKDWQKFGLVAIGSFAFISIDQPLHDWMSRQPTEFTENVAKVIKPSGNIFYLTGGGLLTYGLGAVVKSPKARRFGLLLVKTQGMNALVGQPLNLLTGRELPGPGIQWDDWQGPVWSWHTSFPSNHAQSAFALATLISMEFSDQKALSYLAYSLASLTAISRVHDQEHWPADVFLGSCLGVFVTRFVVKNQDRNTKGSLSLFPSLGTRHAGLNFGWQF